MALPTYFVQCAFSYYNPVIPSKDGQLIQAGDQVPAGGDVSSEKDAKREDGDWVHEVARSYPRS